MEMEISFNGKILIPLTETKRKQKNYGKRNGNGKNNEKRNWNWNWRIFRNLNHTVSIPEVDMRRHSGPVAKEL